MGWCERRKHKRLAGGGGGGDPGGTFTREILKSTFLHSEYHFNPPSQIERNFAAREGVRTNPSHPPTYDPVIRV